MRRVLRYSYPYRYKIMGMLVMILTTTGLTLLTPLILRDLIDRTIPSGDVNRLIWLALALLVIPLLRGIISVFQRQLNAQVGEESSTTCGWPCFRACSVCRCAFSPIPKSAS